MINKSMDWKFQPSTFGTFGASTFRKLMMRTELSADELIAREVIQNSSDAAEKLKSELGRPDLPFEMKFIFKSIGGERKKKFVDSIGLTKLLKRALDVGPKALGINPIVDIHAILDTEPLDVLEMSDYGARGLKVTPKKWTESAYVNCMITIGANKNKNVGAGGTYGFGKSAFINGSKLGVVIAYSCFAPSGPEDLATRRFGGMVYWSDHKLPNSPEEFTGLGALGDPTNNLEWLNLPFEDEAADELAKACGLTVRHQHDPGTWGTSLIVLCPAVEAEDLVPAIEKYWWPALVGATPRMKVSVTGYDQESRQISPKQNPDLKNFIRAFDLAATEEVANAPYELKKEIINEETREVVGTFAGVADPATCFEPKRHDGSTKESLVCLMRSPRMVVKYVEFGRGVASAPFIEGVFIAKNDEDVEKLLQESEPHTHDFWWPRERSKQIEMRRNLPAIHSLVISIKKGLEFAVNALKSAIKPPNVTQKTGLTNFGGILSKLISGGGTGGGPTGMPDPFQINFLQGPTPKLVKPGLIKFYTLVRVGINPDAKQSSYDIKVTFSYVEVMEEDGRGETIPFMHEILEGPSGFGSRDVSGKLSKGDFVEIGFMSDPIDAGKSVAGKCRVKDIGKKAVTKVAQ